MRIIIILAVAVAGLSLTAGLTLRPTLRPAPGSELTLDLDGSSFTRPVVGGGAKVKSAAGMK